MKRRFVLFHACAATLCCAASLPAAVQPVAPQNKIAGASRPAYTLQVGAFADISNAVLIINTLKQHAFEAFYICDGKGLHVVLSGTYATREQARSDAARLEAEGLVDTYLVVPFKGSKAGSGCRPGQREKLPAARNNKPQELPKSAPGGLKNGSATVAAVATHVSRNAEAVVDHDSARSPAHVTVSLAGIAETVQVTAQSQTVIEQREHGGRVYPGIDGSSLPAAAGDPDKNRLATAWEHYNQGRTEEAAALFSALSAVPELSLDATLGVALCHLAGKDAAKAFPLLEQLAKKRYRIGETVPALLKILIDRKEFQQAATYAALLGAKERAGWLSRIDQGRFLQRYARLQERISMAGAVEFVQENQSFLKQCRMPDAFSKLAAFFAQHGRPDEAAAIYRTLLSCTRDEGWQLGILYRLKPLLPPVELLQLAEQQLHGTALSAAQRTKLQTFKIELLHGLIAAEPEQLEMHARAVLKLRPADEIALTALGWWYFARQRYEEAYDCFRQLSDGPSRRSEHLEGMILSLMKLERFDEALAVARLNGNEQKIRLMAQEIQLQILWRRIASIPPDSPELEALADAVLQLRPDNEDIRVVRAWSQYNRQKFEHARQEFAALYARNQRGAGYAYGLASSLAKLRRYDEAVRIAAANKDHDERLAPFETGVYLEQARSAFDRKQYREAEIYFGKVIAAEPDDEESKALLESSRYRQTVIARVLSPIVGLPGHTWGSVYHDLHGTAGTGGSLLLNQGIDWVRLPGDVLLRTYGEAWVRARTKDNRYHDIVGQAAGVELRKAPFRLGAEYVWEQYTRQNKKDQGGHLFLAWYQDWYKYLHDKSDDAGWFNIHSLSGSTYGKVFHDLSGATGTGVSGSVNQGIDWAALPGNIMLNSFLEYRFSFRTRDNRYYNEHGPVVGTELQKPPFRLGVEYYWEHDTERHLRSQRATAYLKWYYDWDLKPDK